MPDQMRRFLWLVIGVSALVVVMCFVWAVVYGSRVEVIFIGLVLVGVVGVIIAAVVTDWLHQRREADHEYP